MTDMKICNRCQQAKDLTAFYSDHNTKDGLSRECRECLRERNRIRRQSYRQKLATGVPKFDSKMCTTCGKTKSLSEFCRVSGNRDGYSCSCRACSQAYARSYHKRLAARRQKGIPQIETKRCSRCGREKAVSESHRAVGKIDGYAALCKECQATSSTKYRERIADRDFEDIELVGRKRCCLCGRQLPVEKFNYCRSSPDGLTSHCRGCGKEYKKEHYSDHQSDYYSRVVDRRREHPEQERAYRKLSEAVSRGEIIRPDACSKCGEQGQIVAHYDDYERPLDVVWLCISCDRQLHARRHVRG